MKGLYGALFISLNTKYRKLRISTVLGFHPIREIFFLSIVTLLVSFWTPFTRESGDELLAQLFHRCKDKNDQNWLCQGTTLNTLIVLGIGVLIRAGLTVATFGSVVSESNLNHSFYRFFFGSDFGYKVEPTYIDTILIFLGNIQPSFID